MTSFEPNEIFGVKGLVAVITGGGTGIGLMYAQALEANGAIVYILGRRQEALEKAASTAKHSNIKPIRCDVTSKESLSSAVSEIQKESGFVNLVIANSGITGPTLHNLPRDPTPSLNQFQDYLWNWNSDEFNNTYAVNTSSVFYTITAFLDLLDKGNKKGNVQQRSQVIAISSIGAFNRVPFAGYAYGSSKAAVVHMMKQFATTLVPYGIRSNVIAPGLFPSEMTVDALANKEWKREEFPEERAGDETDMAGTILFLVSRAGGYVNGNVLVIDGGRLSVLPSTY